MGMRSEVALGDRMFQHHFECAVDVHASPGQLFSELDDQERLSAHMMKSSVMLMPSGPDYRDGALDQLTAALIYGARSRVVITTPYFIPEAALVQARRTAVLRGVTVCLVVSSINDQIMVHLAQRSHCAELLEAGVRIYRYRDRFLHAKHISIDEDIALIGSSNIDVRSFVLNAEVTLVIYDREVSSELAAVQQRQIGCSEALDLPEWQRRPLATRIAENLARLMSPLL